MVILEYIWLDCNNNLRAKTKVLHDIDIIQDLNDVPKWNFDGSSTNQASGENSELILIPVAIFNDPFRLSNHKLILCEVLDKNNNPILSNSRFHANKLFSHNLIYKQKPWFGIEQEYFIFNGGWNDITGSELQGQYYCSVGQKNAWHRAIAEKHFELCLIAGLTVSGMNAEVAPSQWEYQIGPVEGIEASDQLWISRWIMERLSEQFNVQIIWEPKPYPDLNGSGCHVNFSTQNMRNKNGIGFIYTAIDRLASNHKEHMKVYGTNNEYRMTGLHETSSFSNFIFSRNKPVDRGASVRIGYDTINNKCGYFEDRRPASNMDPYLVTAKLVQTICL